MRKTIFYVTSAAMAASIAFSTPAAAENKSEFAKAVVEFCSMFSNGETGGTGLPNSGGCVSSFAAAGPAAFCKSLKDFGILEIFGFETQGACVVALK